MNGVAGAAGTLCSSDDCIALKLGALMGKWRRFIAVATRKVEGREVSFQLRHVKQEKAEAKCEQTNEAVMADSCHT